jgi:hypothetical protein
MMTDERVCSDGGTLDALSGIGRRTCIESTVMLERSIIALTLATSLALRAGAQDLPKTAPTKERAFEDEVDEEMGAPRKAD